MALPANPASPSSPFQSPSDWFAEHSQRNHRNTPHGKKRRADEDAEAPPTIATGFKKLRITPPRRPQQPEHSHPPNVDVQYLHHQPASPTPPHPPAPAGATADHELIDVPVYDQPPPQALHHPQPLRYRDQLLPEKNLCDTPPPQKLPSNNDDFMPVDDNPHRIFIDDLDAAIAEIEAEERAAKEKQQEQAFFLPDDVEKEMSSVPNHVLKNNASGAIEPAPSQALVLYKDPLSLSIPEEDDAVRKAVHEARQRIRDRNSGHPVSNEPHLIPDPPTGMPPPLEHENFGYPLNRQHAEWRHDGESEESIEHDPDAMEIE